MKVSYVDKLIGQLRRDSVEYFFVRKDREFIFCIRTDNPCAILEIRCSRTEQHSKKFMLSDNDEYTQIAADYNWDAIVEHEYDEYTYHYGQMKMRYPGGAKKG